MDRVASDDDGLSVTFDRAWARSVLRQAGDRQTELAADRGDDAKRRVELLRLRFQENLPIRRIATLWATDAAHLHHEFAKAREEFRDALLEIVSFHHPGTPGEVHREAARLLEIFK